MTQVQLIVHPATPEDLKEGAYLLFPHSAGHKLCLVLNVRGRWVYKVHEDLLEVPSFFPQNCYRPA